MYKLLLYTFTVLSFNVVAQQSENLIPKEAITVFSLNNVELLGRIALDELVKYDFMEEVQQELFDGSTNGKTLRDAGIDFNQKLNVFSGRTNEYQVRGLSFGVSDLDALFEVFDDYQPTGEKINGADIYESYFNRMMIQNGSAVLFRITPDLNYINNMTDSIWFERGNEYPWYEKENWYEFEGDEFINDLETEENTSNPDEEIYVEAYDNPREKSYYELRDSLEFMVLKREMSSFCNELFVKQNNLIKNSVEFQQQLTHTTEGIFFSDNSRNLKAQSGWNQISRLYPSMYLDIDELYTGNILLGDLFLHDNQIQLVIDANYGDKLGSIYKELADAKFDKSGLNYIHQDNSSYFLYNVNVEKAYEQIYEVIVPILEKSNDENLIYRLLFIELIDELINKERVFNAYKGSFFGTYSGVENIKTKKIVFEYDEETFEYVEREVEAEEEMPVFTFGLTTNESELIEKFFNRVSRVNEDIHYEDGYWIFENEILNSAPLYVFFENGLMVFTNNSDQAQNYRDGYGAESLSKAERKAAKKSGTLYAYTDMGRAVENLPRAFFDESQNEVLDVFRGKQGEIVITSSETSTEKTSFTLNYNYDGTQSNSGAFILDLINGLYIFSK